MAHLHLTFDCGEDSLKVRYFAVREAISELFAISILARSPNPSIAMEPIVGHPVTFQIETAQKLKLAPLGGTRRWKGIVSAFELSQAEPTGHSTYRLEIVPTLWLLTQKRDYRIFQYLNVPDIIDRVLKPYGIEAEWRCDKGEYPRMEYKTQYGESDFAYFSRLLEDAGLSYWFPEDADCRLIIGDRPQSGPLRGAPLTYRDNPKSDGDVEMMTEVELGHAVRSGAYLLQGQDFRKPDQHPKGEATKAKAPEAMYEQTLYRPSEFLIEYPGRFRDTPYADDRGVSRYDPPWGKHQADVALQAIRADQRVVTFVSNTVDLWPAMIFNTLDHPHALMAVGKKWMITSFSIEGQDDEQWAMHAEGVPQEIPFRSPQKTARPFIRGVQPATVVGWAGDDIHTDEYGRARVLFPWDRGGRTDAQCSVWIRVSQGWAGAGFGLFTLPRVGQEVLVAFIDGDPDQPLLVGRIYNRLHPVPYPLPEYKTRSLWKGDSSPGSNGYSEINLEDLKGDEMLYIHAERHVRTLVKNDETITVVNNRDKNVLLNETDTTLQNRTEVTIGNREETTGAHRTVMIVQNTSKLVKGDEDERVEIEHVVRVGKDSHHVTHENKHELIEIDHHTTVKNNRRDQVDQKFSLGVGTDHFTKVGSKYAAESGDETHYASGSVMVGEAGDVTVKASGGFLRIDMLGVTIGGTLVKINDGGSALAGKGADPKKAKEAAEAKKPKPCPPQNPDITTVDGPKDLGCGGYSWKVWFDLPRPACSPGWVVQEILATFTIDDATGKTKVSETAHYWEAWEVKKGKTQTIWQDEKKDDNDDLYYAPAYPTTKGKITVRGIARFYEGPLPGDFKKNSVPMAGILHATTKKPKFWDNKGTIHDITSVWDCTVVPELTDVSAKAGADEIKGTK